MFDQCWANVVDGGPTLVKHWVDVLCLRGVALDRVSKYASYVDICTITMTTEGAPKTVMTCALLVSNDVMHTPAKRDVVLM